VGSGQRRAQFGELSPAGMRPAEVLVRAGECGLGRVLSIFVAFQAGKKSHAI